MSDKQTLKSQITQLKGLLDSPKTQGSTRKIFESSLKKAEDKLAELEKAEKLESSKKELTPKQEAKVEETKKEAKSLSKALKDKVAKAKEKLAKIKPTKTTKKGGARSVTKAKEIAKEMRSKQKKQSLADKDIESDANRYAINKTKRRSNGGRANQYGTKAENKGGIYYESRENRYDRQNKRYAKLERGGIIDNLDLLKNTIRNISKKMEYDGESGYGGYVVYLGGNKIKISNYDNLTPYSAQATDSEVKVEFNSPNRTMIIFSTRVNERFEDTKSFEKYGGLKYIFEPLTNEISKEILDNVNDFQKKYADGGYEDFGYHNVNREVTLKNGKKVYITKGRYYWQNELVDNLPSGVYYLTNDGNYISADEIKFPLMADGGAIADIGGTKFSTTDLSGMFAHGGATNHGTRFMSHSGMKYENGGQLSMLDGRIVRYNAMGGVSGTFVIDKATVTPDFYRKRDVHLFTKSGSRDSFPLEKLDDFLSGEEVEVRDSKGEAYTLELVGAMKKEFAKGGINKGGAWTRDHYQHNKSESYEVPNKDRVYEKGGDVSEGNLDMLKNQSIQIEHHAKELVNTLKTNPKVDAWVVAKMDRATSNLSDITHYLEGEQKSFADGGAITDIGGTKFSTTDLSGMFAKGGMTEHGLKNGDKIISAKLIGTTIRVRNEALDEDARVDLNTGKRTILTYNAKTKKWDEKMEKGGKIKDQYEGRKPEDVWNNLDKSQRQHFLYDHMHEIEEYRGDEHGELSSKEIIKAYNSNYADLDKNIRNRFDNHVREGQYGKGGKLSKKDKQEFLDELYSTIGNENVLVVERENDVQLSSNNRYSLSDVIKRFSSNERGGFDGVSTIDEVEMDGDKYYYLTIDYRKIDDKMAMGGKTKFKDKVTAISKSLLKRKKVSPSVQKDYGKTYSKSEALDSAKRIAGAMRAKEKMGKGGRLTSMEKKLLSQIEKSYSKSMSDINLSNESRESLRSLYHMGYLNRKSVKGSQDTTYTLKKKS